MKTQFTPGPWALCADERNVYAPKSDTAITNDDHPCYPDEDEACANARLIAAAPELLAALEKCRTLAGATLGPGREGRFTHSAAVKIGHIARAAIAKATQS